MIHDPDAVLTEYRKENSFFETQIVPVLRRIAVKKLAEHSGLDRRTLQRIRVHKTSPSPQNRQKLISIVERWLHRERA